MPNNMPNFVYTKPRQLIIVLCVLLFILILGVWLHGYISEGTITIKTSSANEVQLSGINSTTTVSKSSGNLNATVKSGQYVVIVSNAGSTSKRIVQIKPRHHSTYTINLAPLILPEPVLPFGAYGVYADDTHLLYVSMQDNLLYSVNGNGAPVAVNSSIAFKSISWQSAAYGVGLATDNKTLYLIGNGAVAPIALPFQANTVYYSLPSAGPLVVSDGKTIYKQTPSGQFRKIFSTNNKITSLAAGKANIYIQTSQGPESDGDEATASIVNYSGATIATINNSSAYSYVWSPDGNKLAITNDGSTIVYDAHLSVIARVPDGNVLGMTWLDDSTLLYGQGKNLFSYGLVNGSTTQLSAMNGDNGVSGVYPGQDKGQIYVLSEAAGASSSQDYELMRVGLHSDVPSYKYQLDVFFPAVLNGCSFSFINFSQPIITMAGSDYQSCLSAANTVLSQDQLPSNSFSFSFSPVQNE